MGRLVGCCSPGELVARMEPERCRSLPHYSNRTRTVKRLTNCSRFRGCVPPYDTILLLLAQMQVAMQITVRLFAALAEGAGTRTLNLELPAGARAEAVRTALRERFPQMQGLCERSAVAVNAEYATADRLLYEGDEVALIPPVSGG